LVLACQDTPVAPDVSPQFLIGNSPLTPIQLVPNPDPGSPPLLEVGLVVNKGIAQVALENKFFIRTTGDFKLPDGSTAGAIDPKDSGIVGQKDTGVRQGSDVEIIMDIDIPVPTWDAIKDYNGVAVQLNAELVMVTGSGSEKILDSVTLAGHIDPKDGG